MQWTVYLWGLFGVFFGVDQHVDIHVVSGVFFPIILGQGFMIGEKEATKLKIKEIHFNSLKKKNEMVKLVKLCLTALISDIQFLIFLYLTRYYMTFTLWWCISTAVCYSITGLSYIYTASCYPVKEMLDNYIFYMIWI